MSNLVLIVLTLILFYFHTSKNLNPKFVPNDYSNYTVHVAKYVHTQSVLVTNLRERSGMFNYISRKRHFLHFFLVRVLIPFYKVC